MKLTDGSRLSVQTDDLQMPTAPRAVHGIHAFLRIRDKGDIDRFFENIEKQTVYGKKIGHTRYKANNNDERQKHQEASSTKEGNMLVGN